MTTTISNLSQELLDRTNDYLHSDTKSLKSLSLVSHKWVPRTRYYLFAKIRVYQATTDILINLLDNPLCTFHTSIQQLDLIGGSDRDMAWLTSIAKHIKSGKWTSLTRLTLANMDYNMRNSDACKDFLLSTSDSAWKMGIKELTLGQYVFFECQFLSSNSVKEVMDYLSIVAQFPSLRTLKMDPFGDKARGIDEPIASSNEDEQKFPTNDTSILQLAKTLAPAPNNLTELDITGLHAPCSFPLCVFWEWLRLNHAVSLKKLSIRLDYMTDVDIPFFAKYLADVGDSLKEIKIELGLSGRNTDDMPSPSDIDKARVMLKAILKSFVSHNVLSHSTGLEDIHLDLIYFYDIEHDCPYSLISLGELVKTIPKRSLKHLNILVWTDISSDKEDDGHEWQNGDTLLADQFPLLEQVVVTVTVVQDMNFNEYYSGTMDDHGMDELDESVIEGRVEKLFPRCREKGLLRFVRKPWC